MAARRPLDHYLNLQYPFSAIADPEGGYVITFPDLPGCFTQVETAEEIVPMAEEARRLWIETEYDAGEEIPLPSYPEEYSGKFNARLPKSLHRRLAEGAQRDGVSLNQYVLMLLAEREAVTPVLSPLAALISAGNALAHGPGLGKDVSPEDLYLQGVLNTIQLLSRQDLPDVPAWLRADEPSAETGEKTRSRRRR